MANARPTRRRNLRLVIIRLLVVWNRGYKVEAALMDFGMAFLAA